MSKTGEWGDKTIVYLKKKDNLPKRDKRKCRFYRSADNYCLIKARICTSSTYCKSYSVDTNRFPEEKVQKISNNSVCKNTNETIKYTSIKPKLYFTGIKYIDVDLIYVDRRVFSKPEKVKVQNLIDFYNKNGKLDKPVFVSCDGNQYCLKDKYLRLYTAKKLGLKTVAAKIDDDNGNQLDNAIRKPGTLLKMNAKTSVTVIKADIDKVVVRKNDGTELELDIEYCINKNILSL